MRNEGVLHRVQEERSMLHKIKRRRASFIGHVLLRNSLLRDIIEGKREGGIEVTERHGRRGTQLLLDDLKETLR